MPRSVRIWRCFLPADYGWSNNTVQTKYLSDTCVSRVEICQISTHLGTRCPSTIQVCAHLAPSTPPNYQVSSASRSPGFLPHLVAAPAYLCAPLLDSRARRSCASCLFFREFGSVRGVIAVPPFSSTSLFDVLFLYCLGVPLLISTRARHLLFQGLLVSHILDLSLFFPPSHSSRK